MKAVIDLSTISETFIRSIKDRDASIAILGMGYVGVPLALGLCNSGHKVIGVDIDQSKIDALSNGRSYIAHFSDDRIAEMANSGRFQASSDMQIVSDADAILLCVPTPLDHHREPDLSYVVKTTEAIAPYVKRGQVIILESTTYPGTCAEVLEPLLEKGSGLKANKDFVVAYSPEREDPANPNFDTATIPKVVGASTPEGQEMAAALYETLVNKVVRVSSAETAEAVKLTENIFRAVNIALVNELKLIYDEMGIDVWEVIDAAATKPFGFMPFYPGPGLGGHCIPIDPFYLTWKAREFGRHTRFIELAGEINQNMPSHIVQRVGDALSEHKQRSINGAKILVVGVAYKKNVDDMRESPSLELMEMLTGKGANVDYHDPHVLVIPNTREHASLAGISSVEMSKEMLSSYDTVLIATEHDSIDWAQIGEDASLIVDTRNAMKNVDAPKATVIKA